MCANFLSDIAEQIGTLSKLYNVKPQVVRTAPRRWPNSMQALANHSKSRYMYIASIVFFFFFTGQIIIAIYVVIYEFVETQYPAC